MSTVFERVKKVVVEQLSVDESLVTENASFTADLGADSLDTVELVMAFEEEFGTEIPDEEAEKIKTNLHSFIKARSDFLVNYCSSLFIKSLFEKGYKWEKEEL